MEVQKADRNVEVDEGLVPTEGFLLLTGFRMFAVGVGNAVEDELREIASEPVAEHYFYTADFRTISNIGKKLQMKICVGESGGLGRGGKVYSQHLQDWWMHIAFSIQEMEPWSKAQTILDSQIANSASKFLFCVSLWTAKSMTQHGDVIGKWTDKQRLFWALYLIRFKFLGHALSISNRPQWVFRELEARERLEPVLDAMKCKSLWSFEVKGRSD